MDLRYRAFGIAQAAKLALLILAAPFEGADIGTNAGELTRGADVLTDGARKLDGDEGDDE